MLANSLVLSDRLFRRCSVAWVSQSWDSVDSSCVSSQRTRVSSECSGTNRISSPPRVSRTPSTPLMKMASSNSQCAPFRLFGAVMRQQRSARMFHARRPPPDLIGRGDARDRLPQTLLRKLELGCGSRYLRAFQPHSTCRPSRRHSGYFTNEGIARGLSAYCGAHMMVAFDP